MLKRIAFGSAMFLLFSAGFFLFFETQQEAQQGCQPCSRPSSDPRQSPTPNQVANVDSLLLDKTELFLGCPPGLRSLTSECDDSKLINIKTIASDPENDTLIYNYTVSGGRIVGQGAEVRWYLSGMRPGTYTVTAGVDDGCGNCGKTQTKTVTVKACACAPPPCNCQALMVEGPSRPVAAGKILTFTSSNLIDSTYNWTVTSGTIIAGQGTPTISVRTTADMVGQEVTATVEADQGCSACPGTASESVRLRAFGFIRGTVRKRTPNAALPGAKVELIDPNGDTIATVFTNESGAYNFGSTVAPVTYKIRASADNFIPDTKTVVLTPFATPTIPAFRLRR